MFFLQEDFESGAGEETPLRGLERLAALKEKGVTDSPELALLKRVRGLVPGEDRRRSQSAHAPQRALDLDDAGETVKPTRGRRTHADWEVIATAVTREAGEEEVERLAGRLGLRVRRVNRRGVKSGTARTAPTSWLDCASHVDCERAWAVVCVGDGQARIAPNRAPRLN